MSNSLPTPDYNAAFCHLIDKAIAELRMERSLQHDCGPIQRERMGLEFTDLARLAGRRALNIIAGQAYNSMCFTRDSGQLITTLQSLKADLPGDAPQSEGRAS